MHIVISNSANLQAGPGSCRYAKYSGFTKSVNNLRIFTIHLRISVFFNKSPIYHASYLLKIELQVFLSTWVTEFYEWIFCRYSTSCRYLTLVYFSSQTHSKCTIYTPVLLFNIYKHKNTSFITF